MGAREEARPVAAAGVLAGRGRSRQRTIIPPPSTEITWPVM